MGRVELFGVSEVISAENLLRNGTAGSGPDVDGLDEQELGIEECGFMDLIGGVDDREGLSPNDGIVPINE